MKRLTKSQREAVTKLRALPLCEGEARDIYICQDRKCGQVQAHDYIPFGMGRGCWYNMCHCNAVDSNWVHRARKLANPKTETKNEQ